MYSCFMVCDQVGYDGEIMSWEEWERESLIIQMDNKRKI